MKKIFQIVVLLFVCLTSYSQADTVMLQQVNALRGKKHQLTYNHSKQAEVDRYANSDQLLKRFQHSIGGHYGEIIIQTPDKSDMVDSWRASRHHRMIMVDSRYKSMACKVVLVGTSYYGVIRFYKEK